MPRERSEVALGTNGKGVTGFVPVLVAHRPRRPLPVIFWSFAAPPMVTFEASARDHLHGAFHGT